ncbi:hypothetical protein GWK47_015090 [Chionoecetes opilio]|uniref:Uncharacterized protein n=1 Tax=Chionoecetes opilio TaxID=41210 RepID=A0A8J4XS96_CHIOP|nr:hypothetical protein GWK47_015090 [Chionoecetes opilio]
MAEAVLKAVSDAGLEACIQGIVFDTTASNTGPNGGACIKIQEGLGRNLLWFACRHHILEVILGDVFKHCYGPSGGPNVPLFVRFQDQWDVLDQKSWTSSMDEESLLPLLTGELSDARDSFERAQECHRTRKPSKRRLQGALGSLLHLPERRYWDDFQDEGTRSVSSSEMNVEGNLRSQDFPLQVSVSADLS